MAKVNIKRELWWEQPVGEDTVHINVRVCAFLGDYEVVEEETIFSISAVEGPFQGWIDLKEVMRSVHDLEETTQNALVIKLRKIVADAEKIKTLLEDLDGA